MEYLIIVIWFLLFAAIVAIRILVDKKCKMDYYDLVQNAIRECLNRKN